MESVFEPEATKRHLYDILYQQTITKVVVDVLQIKNNRFNLVIQRSTVEIEDLGKTWEESLS